MWKRIGALFRWAYCFILLRFSTSAGRFVTVLLLSSFYFSSRMKRKKNSMCNMIVFRVWTLFQRFISLLFFLSFVAIHTAGWCDCMCVRVVFVVAQTVLPAHTRSHSDGVHFAIYRSYIWHNHTPIELMPVFECVCVSLRCFYSILSLRRCCCTNRFRHACETNECVVISFFLSFSLPIPFAYTHHICGPSAFI